MSQNRHTTTKHESRPRILHIISCKVSPRDWSRLGPHLCSVIGDGNETSSSRERYKVSQAHRAKVYYIVSLHLLSSHPYPNKHHRQLRPLVTTFQTIFKLVGSSQAQFSETEYIIGRCRPNGSVFFGVWTSSCHHGVGLKKDK